MRAGKKDIAFFDIDKTIIKINSGIALVKHAYRQGELNTLGIIKAALTGIQYKYTPKDTHTIIKKMGSWLNGIAEERLNKIANEILTKDLIPNIRPNIITEIQKLKNQGTEVVILSSAISAVCIPLGKHLNMDAVICTELEVENGKFTGHPVNKFCFRDEKLIRLKEFCRKRNFNLANAAYYADAIDDLPALEAVGFPVCVSPDKKLNKVAIERGWLVQNWE